MRSSFDWSIRPFNSRRRLAGFIVVAMFAFAAVAAIGVRTALGSGGGGLCQPNGGSPACTVKAHNAFADFQTTSADGCILTDASIQAFEAVASPGHTLQPAVFLNTFSFNNCLGMQVESGSNIDPSGNPVFTGTLQFSTPLNTAVVSGTAPIFDGTGTLLFTLTVNLSWQAFGPTTTFIDSSHSHVPGVYVTSSHTNSSTRGAVASGSMTDENSNSFVGAPTLNALVQDAISGSVLIFKP